MIEVNQELADMFLINFENMAFEQEDNPLSRRMVRKYCEKFGVEYMEKDDAFSGEAISWETRTLPEIAAYIIYMRGLQSVELRMSDNWFWEAHCIDDSERIWCIWQKGALYLGPSPTRSALKCLSGRNKATLLRYATKDLLTGNFIKWIADTGDFKAYYKILSLNLVTDESVHSELERVLRS